MHFENGYIKINEEKVEALYSHIFGVNDIEYGSFFENSLILEANKDEHFQRINSSSGKKTTAIKREYMLNEKGNLCYNMYLGVDGNDLILHLTAELEKVL